MGEFLRLCLLAVEDVEHGTDITNQKTTRWQDLNGVAYMDQKVTDKLMQRLSKFLDADTIVELMTLIAFQNMSSKFNSAVDAPPQGFCQSPAIEK